MVANERGGEQMELSLGFWLSDDVVVQVSIDVANFFFIFLLFLFGPFTMSKIFIQKITAMTKLTRH